MSEVNYGSYLNLERILQAQNPPGPDGEPRSLHHHDEMLFVIVHQVYELWFKQILHELERSRDLLAADPVLERDVPSIAMALHRVHRIQQVMVAQLGIIETMSPMDFLAFRDSLGSASAFQSAQFRELEILAGLPDEARHEYEGASFERHFDAETVARFDRRREQLSLRRSLYHWLERTPIEEGFIDTYLERFGGYVDGQRTLHRSNPQLSDTQRTAVLQRLDAYVEDCQAFLSGDQARMNAACLFIVAYRDEPLLHWPNRLLDSLLEFEELLRLWRFRHARMVERMIGLRVGTGGSSGVDYLDATAGSRYRVFTVILESRSFLIPRRMLPDLKDPGRYGFATD